MGLKALTHCILGRWNGVNFEWKCRRLLGEFPVYVCSAMDCAE